MKFEVFSLKAKFEEREDSEEQKVISPLGDAVLCTSIAKIDFILPVVTHCQSKIGDYACQVAFDQDIFGLDVPVSDLLLATSTRDLRVQMGNAGSSRMSHDQL